MTPPLLGYQILSLTALVNRKAHAIPEAHAEAYMRLPRALAIPGTQFADPGGMTGWVNLAPGVGFEPALPLALQG